MYSYHFLLNNEFYDCTYADLIVNIVNIIMSE